MFSSWMNIGFYRKWAICGLSFLLYWGSGLSVYSIQNRFMVIYFGFQRVKRIVVKLSFFFSGGEGGEGGGRGDSNGVTAENPSIQTPVPRVIWISGCEVFQFFSIIIFKAREILHTEWFSPCGCKLKGAVSLRIWLKFSL